MFLISYSIESFKIKIDSKKWNQKQIQILKNYFICDSSPISVKSMRKKSLEQSPFNALTNVSLAIGSNFCFICTMSISHRDTIIRISVDSLVPRPFMALSKHEAKYVCLSLTHSTLIVSILNFNENYKKIFFFIYQCP